jgi:preprotein translocase SecE subunit
MAFSVYKKGQGSAARGVAGVVAVFLGVWAARSMWSYGPAVSNVYVRTVLTAIVAFIFGLLPLGLVLFHRAAVDLLIETQQEMRKVAWSTRAEVTGSTIVVIATVAILSMFIYLVDFILHIFFSLLGLY